MDVSAAHSTVLKFLLELRSRIYDPNNCTSFRVATHMNSNDIPRTRHRAPEKAVGGALFTLRSHALRTTWRPLFAQTHKKCWLKCLIENRFSNNLLNPLPFEELFLHLSTYLLNSLLFLFPCLRTALHSDVCGHFKKYSLGQLCEERRQSTKVNNKGKISLCGFMTVRHPCGARYLFAFGLIEICYFWILFMPIVYVEVSHFTSVKQTEKSKAFIAFLWKV